MTRKSWSIGKIAVVLYPFGAGAMMVNVFFAGLIISWMGMPVIPPIWSVIGGAILGLPATWIFARHIKTLMERADTD